MTVTDGRQLKAGRVILGMTIKDMAELAGLHKNSVIRVEGYGTLPRSAYAANKIQKALESLGIKFEIKEGLAGLFFAAATKRTKTPIPCQQGSFTDRPSAQFIDTYTREKDRP